MFLSLFWHATSWLLLPVQALAESTNEQQPIVLFDPLEGMSVMDLIDKIVQGLTVLAIPVVTIMVIIGAYYLITSGGNPGRRSKGKDYILWAAIGFAVLLLSSSVIPLIQDILQ